MTGVSFDAARRAFVAEGGVLLRSGSAVTTSSRRSTSYLTESDQAAGALGDLVRALF
jgi:hypothetical protein